jgi:hypothetical protein
MLPSAEATTRMEVRYDNRYRVQYTQDREVKNEYFHSVAAACDFAASVGRALVIDQLENSEVWYCPEVKRTEGDYA